MTDLEGKLRELARRIGVAHEYPFDSFAYDRLCEAAALGRAEGLSELNDAKRMAMEYREAWYKVMAERDEAIRALKEKHVEL